ncbi:MAG: galactokinase family protein [Acidobacteriota bacterium]
MKGDLLEKRLRERVGPVGELFGVTAPLRACPLGAHVDHQGGEVTGLALDRAVRLLARPRDEPVITLESVGFPGVIEVDLRRGGQRRGDWGDYLRAVVAELSERGDLSRGLDGVMQGDLVGMGVSSSAAVMVAYCLALAEVNRIELKRSEIAHLIQRAENRHIGVASGLLDQSVILFAETGKLTHIDCGDSTVDQIAPEAPLPDFRIVIAFSGMARQLTGTDYNDRVGECREAALVLLSGAGVDPGPDPLLCQVAPGMYAEQGPRLPENLRRRAAHYFTEVVRVHDGIAAWRRGDLHAFGALMTASGESSIVNYECGTPPMVALFESLREAPGVFGARFSGAGFGGSCLALVAAGATDDIIERVSRTYTAAFPEAARKAQYAVCRPAGRAEVVAAGEFS